MSVCGFVCACKHRAHGSQRVTLDVHGITGHCKTPTQVLGRELRTSGKVVDLVTAELSLKSSSLPFYQQFEGFPSAHLHLHLCLKALPI